MAGGNGAERGAVGRSPPSYPARLPDGNLQRCNVREGSMGKEQENIGRLKAAYEEWSG